MTCSKTISSAAFALIVLLIGTEHAAARVTPDAYRRIGVTVPENASLPTDATVTDEAGQQHRLASLLGHPTLLVFADYACRTLCGPVVALAVGALEQSGLRPGEQYRMIVIGLDPHATAADAARMRQDHLGDSPVGVATVFVNADDHDIEAITSALGYRYVYEDEAGQYIHPAAAYALTADGKVSRLLNDFGLSGSDIRLALVEASQGLIGTLGDQVRLLCSAFDPAHGTYNVLVSRMLAIAALMTVVLLGGLILALSLTARRAA